MPYRARAALVLAACAAPLPAAAAEPEVRTGAAAFGGWKDDGPGVRRLITPNDLPAPYATRSASNSPGVVDRPPDAAPKTLPGFAAEVIASGLDGPRQILTAPNGDVLISEMQGGTVRVLRLAGAKVRRSSVLARGLDEPFGLALYPPGPKPRWLYVANTSSVVRFPYRPGGPRGPRPGRDGGPAAAHRRPRHARPRVHARRLAHAGVGRLREQRLHRRRGAAHGGAEGPRARARGRCPLGPGGVARRRPLLRARRLRPAGLRHRPAQLRHPHDPARDRPALVRRQRARRPRRQPRARLRHPRGAGRLLRLALVLSRRQRGPAAQGRAARPRGPSDHSGRPVPGPLGHPRPRLLRRRPVPARVPRRRLRRHARLVEPRHAHRLQGRPNADARRPPDRCL